MNIERPSTSSANRSRSMRKGLLRPAIESLESRQLYSAGLAATYFSDPDLTTQAFARTDPAIRFNWGKKTPAASLPGAFSVSWTGMLTAPVTGTVTFRDRASDGIRVWIGGELIINDWNQHKQAVSHAAKLALVAGQQYSLQVEYFHNLGPAVVSLGWSAPHLKSGIVPTKDLDDGTGTTVGTTPPVTTPVTPPVTTPVTTGAGTGTSTGTGSGTGKKKGPGSSSTSTPTTTSTGTSTGATTSTGTTTGTSTGSTGTGSGAITPVLSTAPSTITWSGPLVITRGGAYTGNWQSTNANTPAVDIETSDPVTIINSNVQGRGGLIVTGVNNVNLTVKDTNGWALNPDVSGQSPGRFLDAENFDNLDIENNTMVGTAGIEMGYYAGNGTALQTVKILYNDALNIDGRWSDGNGGYQSGPDANDYVQFAQFNACHNMTGVVIAWNQVVNQPGQSRVEDNISVFQSSGTAASPILIYDNYIDGAYPADPATDDTYTGGGIMVSDGNTNSASTDTGHVRAYNNTVIDTTNYGIAVSSGLDDQVYDNVVISTGKLSTGQVPASQNVGIYVWNQSGDPFFQQPQVHGNVVGWMGPNGSRNDEWTPDASSVNDTSLSGSITTATEQSYYSQWTQGATAAGLTIGA